MKKHLAHALTWNSPVESTRPNVYAYASAASAIVTEVTGIRAVHGKCLRTQWFRIKQVPKKAYPGCKPGYSTGWIGDAVHEATYDEFRKAGTYVDSEVPMWDGVRMISGRADLLFRDHETGEIIGADVKTKWGYHGELGVIKPTKKAPLFPNYNDIFQAAVYLDWFKQFGINKWGIFYVHRGNGNFNEHYVMLPSSKNWSGLGAAIPRDLAAKDGKIEVENEDYSVVLDVGPQDIYERWDTLWAHCATRSIPPRDYWMQYQEDMLDDMSKEGRLSKTSDKEFKSKGFTEKGDYQCRYCDYNYYCWNEDKWRTPKTEDTILKETGIE